MVYGRFWGLRSTFGSCMAWRYTAHDVLKVAFEVAGLNGKLATPSLRKSFAQRLYDHTGDIFAVQEMLGHHSVATPQKYLGVNYASIRDALEGIRFRFKTLCSSYTHLGRKEIKGFSTFFDIYARIGVKKGVFKNVSLVCSTLACFAVGIPTRRITLD